MKKIVAILTFTLLFILPTMANDSRKAVEDGFAKGDAEIVSQAMSDKVFMVAYPLRRPLSKDEATKELANFFLQNKPKSFSVLHILIDVIGDNERITQIRIETL